MYTSIADRAIFFFSIYWLTQMSGDTINKVKNKKNALGHDNNRGQIEDTIALV